MSARVLAHLVLLVSLWLGMTAVPAPGSQSHVSSAAAPARAGLHVAGNRLVDNKGSSVVLRGVNISGTEFACAQGGSAGSAGWSIFGGQPEDTPSTISAIQQWHANVVRIPLNEDCWLGINGVSAKFGGQTYRAAILKFVQDLSSAGMYVIVDLHWSAPGTALALSQQPMADEDHAPGFWTSVATTFATDTNVIFDLYNEPFLYASYFQSTNQDSWLCWLTGCTLNQYLTGGQPYTKPRSWRTAGMQEMIDVVRATGATNVVIANGLNWANDDSGWLAHMPHDPTSNFVAGWHEYEGEQCAALACWTHAIAPIAQRLPVVVGETGDHTGGSCKLVNLPAFLPWADSLNVSYLAWTFNPWGYTHDVLITDWKGTPSACEGQYYAAHLAALALNPPAQQSAQATPVPRGTSAPHQPSTNVTTGLRILYIAMLLLGLLGILLGIAMTLTKNTSQKLTNRRLMNFVQLHRSICGVVIAMCGAAVSVSATFLVLDF